ncbi:unnamed protein product, partial [Brenthis ino]
MSTEDVIELGSSDEEAEPAPKKRKAMPNAMVVIPSECSGVTIKGVKSSSSIKNANIQPKPVSSTNDMSMGSKPIIVRNMNNNYNANILKQRSNLIPVHIPVIKNISNDMKCPVVPRQKLSINPMSYIQNFNNKNQLTITKSNPNKNYTAMVIRGPKFLNNLPPGITIKPVTNPGASGTKRKQVVNKPKTLMPKVSTVEIDDEPVESSTGNPQWYLRPEEQRDNNSFNEEVGSDVVEKKTEMSMEEQNNKEPETQKFVEITIEDSPVKQLHSKHSNEIGKELTITIDDSPVKPIFKNNNDIHSDSEQCGDKTPLSKKKLEYPKENYKEKQVVEIEIDIMQPNIYSCNNNSKEETICTNKSNIEKSPMEVNIDSKNGASDVNNKDQTTSCEFHPIYQNFIDLCFQLEDSADMTKIVEKKIKAYYKQCPKEYVESEEFIEMVSSKITSIKASPEKLYLFIKDIVDELNLQRKMTKSHKPKKEDLNKDSLHCDTQEDNEYDYKRQRQIRKLEKTIKKLHRAVQKLEEQEVDFEDDEDSVYLLTERYKERLIRVYEKFCQMINTKMPSEPRLHIEARPGRPPGPAKKLEMWINKKVPIGTPLPFPDFHDVLRCVREANNQDKLGWNEVDIMEEAQDLFTRCGKKLQRRRQENEWRIASSRVAHHVDPAESSADLKKKFEENKKIAAIKESELLNKYVERQNQMNLQPVEIEDKEADESPVESEEEDLVEEKNSLDDKQRRKVTLKRLIEERSKKNEEKKDNTPLENVNIDETKMAESKTTEKKVTTKDDESNKMDVDIAIDVKQNYLIEEKQDKFGVDDSDDVASGIDELNLLSKLYSENELDSSQDCSDSDVSVITLDTLGTDSENENVPWLISEDVISIENSSYSESESTMDGQNKKACPTPIVEDIKNKDTELEISLIADNENDTREEIVENILLASSDEENTNPIQENIDCINLRDDSLSISETMLVGETCEKESVDNDDSIVCVNENPLQSISESTFNAKDIEDKCVDENSATSSIISLQNNDVRVDEVKDLVDVCTSDANSVESVDLQIEENVQKGSPKQILNVNNESSTIVQDSDEKDNNNSNQSASVFNDA